MTWQLALLLWAVGAFAAVPVSYELQDRYAETHGGTMGLTVASTLLGCAIWPLAWVAFLIFLIMKALRR